MKTLYAIALIASLSAVGHAQNRTMADATHAIKGPSSGAKNIFGRIIDPEAPVSPSLLPVG